MALFNAKRLQREADKQLRSFGGSGFLVRDGVKRPAQMTRLDYTPRELGLLQEGAERILISALNLSVPPDHKQDLIEFTGNVYRMIKPATGPRPKDVQIFWDCAVVYDSKVT